MWQVSCLQILTAIALDLVLGDPRKWPHIAKMAGWLSAFYEKHLTTLFSRNIFSGLLFWLLVNATMLAGFGTLHLLLSSTNKLAAQIFDSFIIYQSIAATDLVRHVRAILVPLKTGDITAARDRLSWIVGRDTENLDEDEISRATIESIAESTTDGVIAPLFWAFLGGAPGALLYRTCNTLDSIAGHRTAAYEKFGKASARIDDVLNWLPSRISAAVFCLLKRQINWIEVCNSARKHASPNAGWGEAAMAHALGVRLGGDNFYDGERISGPVFNPQGRPATLDDIESSLAWMWRTIAGCTGLFIIVRFILNYEY